ncbi:SpoIIE family protein phosphatase [Bacteroidota bacterium]
MDEVKYKSLVENLNNIIFTTDLNYCFDYISPSFKSYFDEDPTEYIGKSVISIVNEEFTDEVSIYFENYKSDIENNKIEFKTKFSKCPWIEIQFQKVLDGSKFVGFQGIVSNITERKFVEHEIYEANRKILYQQESITDSLHYAEKIQQAVLPREAYIKKCFTKHFVLYKPKDIVSGDFYWITRKAATIMVAIADCTGHGVPGAFMSMLGISFLNDILRKSMKYFFTGNLTASDMLEQLRKSIKKALKQSSAESLTKDGMDMSFIIVDLDTKHLQFAGAFNPLIHIRNKEITKIKGDRNPIGIHLNEVPFTNHEMQLETGDTLYMFTDGYIDQFGGPNNKKFLSKRLEELLHEIHEKPLLEQKEILDNTLINWMGDNEQVDDICLFGCRIEEE